MQVFGRPEFGMTKLWLFLQNPINTRSAKTVVLLVEATSWSSYQLALSSSGGTN
jgi:hypothetical protein